MLLSEVRRAGFATALASTAGINSRDQLFGSGASKTVKGCHPVAALNL